MIQQIALHFLLVIIRLDLHVDHNPILYLEEQVVMDHPVHGTRLMDYHLTQQILITYQELKISTKDHVLPSIK